MKILLFLTVFSVQAKLFKISCSGRCDSAVLKIATQIEDEFNGKLPDIDPKIYVKGMNTAGMLSIKNLGIDYASEINRLMTGFTVGAGVALGSDLKTVFSGKFTEKTLRGFGGQASLLFGVNPSVLASSLGPVDLSRLRIFFNFGLAKHKLKTHPLEFASWTTGLHFRHKILKPVDFLKWRTLRWNGLDAGFGLQAQSLKIDFQQNLKQAFASGEAKADFEGRFQALVKNRGYSAPLELATGVQLGYLLTLYGGMGVDANFGSNRILLTGDTPIDLSEAGTTLKGTVGFDETASPDLWGRRLFAGFQFNFGKLKLAHVQINKDLANPNAWGVSVRAAAYNW